MLKRDFPPWDIEEFEYHTDKMLLCTELVNEAWMRVGYPIVPRGVIPLPAAFKKAEEYGKIDLIFKGII